MKLIYRQATLSDIAELVVLLADDELGAKRERVSEPVDLAYLAAFKRIEADPNNELTVVEYNAELVGMLQLTFIPYLSHIGAMRCLIEGVRISKTFRGKGLGRQMIQWAIKRSGEKNCSIVQLTSDKKRPDALRFYASLGFQASHEGYKLRL